MSAYPRLYRSRRHKVIAGVAAGLADRFNVPIWLSRLVWVLLLLPGGLPGVVPYAILWILIPQEPPD
jgi:phage shock protein PspC (stress-responsive transcriptional regulator)